MRGSERRAAFSSLQQHLVAFSSIQQHSVAFSGIQQHTQHSSKHTAGSHGTRGFERERSHSCYCSRTWGRACARRTPSGRRRSAATAAGCSLRAAGERRRAERHDSRPTS
eukprot:5850623-Prymnesium_polylepis.1